MAISVLMWALMVQAVPAVSVSSGAVQVTIAIQIAEVVSEAQAIEETPSLRVPYTGALPVEHPVPSPGFKAALRDLAPKIIIRAGPRA